MTPARPGLADGTDVNGPSLNAAMRATASFTAVYDATGGLTLTEETIQRRFAVNANGGYIPFTPLPGFHIPVQVGTSVSFRSLSGTSNIVINVSVEEVDD